MKSTYIVQVLARSVILVVLFGTIGCGGGPPPPADKGESVGLLRSALEAWQTGKLPADLKNGSPSIIFVDAAWTDGVKLAKFEIDEAAAVPNGYDLGCPVKLWLGDGKKPPVKVRYVIALSPSKVITRDFGG